MNRGALMLFAALASISHSLTAQCSDAGVCSIGRPSDDSAHSISLSYGFGKSGKADSLTFHSMEAMGSFEILDGGRVIVALPFNSQSGPLGSVAGIGDLTLLWNQEIFSDETSSFGFQAGAKIALADGNAGNLPQAYQSGLGTNDILFGFRYEIAEWNLALAYQLSPGRSANTVTRLRRGDDLLLRGGYSAMIDALRLSGEILAISRLHTSSVITSAPGQPETFGDVPKSDQTQINIVARGSYPVADAIDVDMMIALPLLQRDVNVDGLTRSIALSAGFTLSL